MLPYSFFKGNAAAAAAAVHKVLTKLTCACLVLDSFSSQDFGQMKNLKCQDWIFDSPFIFFSSSAQSIECC